MIRSGPPLVTLRSASARPYDGAIAAARTCYSPRVVGPEEVTASQRDSIGPLTFEAGHHTVYQHAHFEFGLENVSRQFVWSFLHSHPFYNSEQSSQRFVRLDEIRAYVPPGLSRAALEVYEQAVEGAWGSYRRLAELLKEDTLRILSELRHLSPNAAEKRRKKVEREAEKKAIETADKGLELMPGDEYLANVRAWLGVRSRPAVPFLDRTNPINISLGQARHAKKFVDDDRRKK